MITPQLGGACVAQVSTQTSAAAPSSAIASCSAPPGQVGAGVLSFLDHDSVSSRSVDSSTQAQAPPPNREEADYGTCAGPVQVLAPQVSAQGQAPPPEELETGQAQALAKAPQAKGNTKAPPPSPPTAFAKEPRALQLPVAGEPATTDLNVYQLLAVGRGCCRYPNKPPGISDCEFHRIQENKKADTRSTSQRRRDSDKRKKIKAAEDAALAAAQPMAASCAASSSNMTDLQILHALQRRHMVSAQAAASSKAPVQSTKAPPPRLASPLRHELLLKRRCSDAAAIAAATAAEIRVKKTHPVVAINALCLEPGKGKRTAHVAQVSAEALDTLPVKAPPSSPPAQVSAEALDTMPVKAPPPHAQVSAEALVGMPTKAPPPSAKLMTAKAMPDDCRPAGNSRALELEEVPRKAPPPKGSPAWDGGPPPKKAPPVYDPKGPTPPALAQVSVQAGFPHKASPFKTPPKPPPECVTAAPLREATSLRKPPPPPSAPPLAPVVVDAGPCPPTRPPPGWVEPYQQPAGPRRRPAEEPPPLPPVDAGRQVFETRSSGVDSSGRPMTVPGPGRRLVEEPERPSDGSLRSSAQNGMAVPRCRCKDCEEGKTLRKLDAWSTYNDVSVIRAHQDWITQVSAQTQAPPPNREEADYGTCAGPVQVLAPQVPAQGQAPPPEELETGQAQALAKAAQAKGDTKAPHGGYRPNSCTGFDRSPPDLQYFPLRRHSNGTPPAPAFDEMD
jgi:hypothetical protein